MILWHHQLIHLIPGIELYYMQILCQSVINQTISLTSNYRLENVGKEKYYAASDMLAYRFLILREMRKRKLPVWQLNFPWPYQREGFRRYRDKGGKLRTAEERSMIKSYPMCCNNYYLSPVKSKCGGFGRLPGTNRWRFIPAATGSSTNFPNLLVGLFTQASYLYQYALLMDNDAGDEKIPVLNKYRKEIMKGNHIDTAGAIIDNDILVILRFVKHGIKGIYIADGNGELRL